MVLVVIMQVMYIYKETSLAVVNIINNGICVGCGDGGDNEVGDSNNGDDAELIKKQRVINRFLLGSKLIDPLVGKLEGLDFCRV